jgi:hypothetical protein
VGNSFKEIFQTFYKSNKSLYKNSKISENTGQLKMKIPEEINGEFRQRCPFSPILFN